MYRSAHQPMVSYLPWGDDSDRYLSHWHHEQYCPWPENPHLLCCWSASQWSEWTYTRRFWSIRSVYEIVFVSYLFLFSVFFPLEISDCLVFCGLHFVFELHIVSCLLLHILQCFLAFWLWICISNLLPENNTQPLAPALPPSQKDHQPCPFCILHLRVC